MYSVQNVPTSKIHMTYAYLRSQVSTHNFRLAPLPIRVVYCVKESDCFEVVDGFKRLKAAKEAGVKQVCVVLEEAKGPEIKALLLRANALQKTIKPLDEARVVQSLIKEDGMTLAAAARLLKRKRSWASKRFALVQRLSTSLHQAVDEGRLPVSVAYTLSSLKKEEQVNLARTIVQSGLSVSNALAMISTYRCLEDEEKRQALLRDPLGTLGEISRVKQEDCLGLSALAKGKLNNYRELSRLLEVFAKDTLPLAVSPAEGRLLEAERKLLRAKIISYAQDLLSTDQFPINTGGNYEPRYC